MELEELFRRKQAGQSISEIAEALGGDRKTIRKYLGLITAKNGSQSESPSIKQMVLIAESAKREAAKQEVFVGYETEIKELLTRAKQPLKLKSVYEVICTKHELWAKSSLSSFRRFVISHNLRSERREITCRIERHPGEEIQVDYAKMGQMTDPVSGKKVTVYAFIGSLASSRHKYIEFVYRQDQVSFAESHAKMFTFFGGVTKIVTLDNLKAGVIKPDLYNPLLNRTYADMAKHYNCFVNPARVASPKDKPTVERDVQTVREEYLKLLTLNPGVCLSEANRHIKDWVINTYGKRKHGTTQECPYEFFLEVEQPLLTPLPPEVFSAAVWKEAKVHPDCFIQVNKKAYSVPFLYVGKTLNVKVRAKTIEVYYLGELIKEHLIPKIYRQTDYTDFPEDIQKAIDTKLPYYLQTEAERISGVNLRLLVRNLLTPHAFINLRRAQGILSVAAKFDRLLVEQASLIAGESLQGLHPKSFEHLILNLQLQNKEEESQVNNALTLCPETQSFVRTAQYFSQN